MVRELPQSPTPATVDLIATPSLKDLINQSKMGNGCSHGPSFSGRVTRARTKRGIPPIVPSSSKKWSCLESDIQAKARVPLSGSSFLKGVSLSCPT
ncbi:hypothetical protein Tsubulata_042519 [Turnera subulata]|uniref:Uncharacterized protein n=1 Tax=Turnera subulata TaxID=218843 RepID=A0A9Q0FXA5_9ROSI|nr:hypothetical protein Tsubulata_042519 [Turnera subulata]